MFGHMNQKQNIFNMAVSMIIVSVMLLAAVFVFLITWYHENRSAGTVGGRENESTVQTFLDTIDRLGSGTGGSTTEDAKKASDEEAIHIVEGDDRISNRYGKASHLSYTSSIRYTEADLEKLNADGLRITRNEIFARHGRMFNDRDLQDYFSAQSWYIAKYPADEFDDKLLNETERYNVDLIRSFELNIGVNTQLTK